MNNRRSRHADVNLFCKLTTLVAALLVILAMLFPARADNWTDSPLLHNSNRFGTCSNAAYSGTSKAECEDPAKGNGVWTPTAKWGGEWGMATGKYGGFTCETCHERGNGNIKLFKNAVTSPGYPAAPFPCETPDNQGCDVSFQTTSNGGSDFGDDTGGHTTSGKPCEICHSITNFHRFDTSGQTDLTHYNRADCTLTCHSHKTGFRHGGGEGTGCGSATSCHGLQKSHPTHVSGQFLSLDCSDCHDTSSFPKFRDGSTTKSATTVCDNCHTAGGAVKAKQYFGNPGSSAGAAGSWAAVEGQKSFCGSCHNAVPGNSKGDGTGNSAFNVLGNDSTYGFFVTGHGKQPGNYARLSWQDASASGNPAAGRRCGDCHDLTSIHFGNSGMRLKAGYANNQANDNCNQCHPPGTQAAADPQFYTGSSGFEASAHRDRLCTDCHDVHGVVKSGSQYSQTYAGMTRADRQNLCNQCHAGVGGHPGAGSTQFSANGKSYTLQCVSCHNVHIVTGRYSEAGVNKSPVTRFVDNTNVWGDDPSEKMSAYAGSGTYRTPTGESFTGAQLPDYATFCTDCHGQSGSAPFGINWSGDPHGKGAANQPNGYGTCPNWFACGKAFGWDNDTCISTQAECWPVMPRGSGDELFSRGPYTHTERVAGANFTLSCTDCHTGHGTGTLGRPNVNGGSFTSIWNTMCNNCHYYYSDWHAGMSCANASCHVSERMNQTGTATIHGMANSSGSGGTRTHEPGLVLYYAFENNLKDSGGWEMDGKWYSTAGSFAAGKSGQAAVLGEDIGVQVGTENGYWSTDAGKHGTWVYTEMKYNTSLEAWVNPTDNAKSEYTIFSKHVGVSSNGGYALTLKKIGGTLRVAFNMAADNNGFAQDGRAGVRGAYSSVAVPLNKWTHVAATFDTNGPDRNPSDPSVGRIRIYVNGEDVTTSDWSGGNMQPGANETSIFAYSENSPWNESICYDGHWCASEFSIGGFDWESTNFIGRIDGAKVWNVTKNAAYFSAYDSQAGPYISSAVGLVGGSQLTVIFSEGVFASSNGSGALQPSDFVYTDNGYNNPRTITGVTHAAGAATATIAMSGPLASADVNADTIAAAGSAIYDNFGNAAGTETVTVGVSSQCPSPPVTFNLNEPSGSASITDAQGILYGAVYGGAATLTGTAFSGGGDGSGRYMMFDYNTSCLQASTAMTIEARIKPAGLSGTANYIRRILARDGSGNFQISVWRNNSAYPGQFNAPSGEAVIALWINPSDYHGGNSWKPVLTNYTGAKTGSENDCPIVSDHWYLVRAVWNTNKPGGVSGQFFTPADIYIDDQGTDGNGAGENWTGYINCTDSDQSLKTDIVKFYTGDSIKPYSGDNFTIGANRSNPANNLFNGLIDWITWKDSAE